MGRHVPPAGTDSLCVAAYLLLVHCRSCLTHGMHGHDCLGLCVLLETDAAEEDRGCQVDAHQHCRAWAKHGQTQ